MTNYSNDAKIQSLAAGGTVGKGVFRQALLRVGEARVTYSRPSIVFSDPTHAIADVNFGLANVPYHIQYRTGEARGPRADRRAEVLLRARAVRRRGRLR